MCTPRAPKQEPVAAPPPAPEAPPSPAVTPTQQGPEGRASRRPLGTSALTIRRDSTNTGLQITR